MLPVLGFLTLLIAAIGAITWAAERADRGWEQTQRKRAAIATTKYALIVPDGITWVPENDAVARVICLVNGQPRPGEIQFVDDEVFVFAVDNRQVEADRAA